MIIAELIFEPFFRGDRDPSGLRLGLAIAKSVVELRNGRVWVEDNPGASAAPSQLPRLDAL